MSVRVSAFLYSLCVENLWLVCVELRGSVGHSRSPSVSLHIDRFHLFCFSHIPHSFVSIDWHSLVLMDFHASVDTIVASSSSGSISRGCHHRLVQLECWLLLLVRVAANFYSKTYLQRERRKENRNEKNENCIKVSVSILVGEIFVLFRLVFQFPAHTQQNKTKHNIKNSTIRT